MNNFSFHQMEIKGMATAVPNDKEKIEDYAPYFPEGEISKFCETTNIYERYVGYRRGVIASDLCVAAADKVFSELNFDKSTVDAILFLTQSFDYESPATSGIIQMRLGLDHCGPVYDVTYGCAAFPFGLQLAGSFITGGCRNVLLLIGDSPAWPNSRDKDSLLFGDAGSAILLGKAQDTPSIDIRLETLGKGYQSLMAPFGQRRHPSYKIAEQIGWENAPKIMHRYMDGADIFTFSIKDAVACTKRFYADFHYSSADFDFLAIHQANRLIVDNVAKRIKFPKERVPLSLDRYGNASSTSVSLSICDYFEHNDALEEARVLALGFGVGLSIGVAALTLKRSVCFPILFVDSGFDDGLSNYEEYLKKPM